MVLQVNASKKYDIIIDKGVSDNFDKYLSKILSPCKVLIVSDSLVPEIHYNKIIEKLNKSGYMSFKYIIPSGESSKSFIEYQNILTFMVENNFSRKDAVIAVGGGVVGDLSGFVASTYMRGITFINVPTTLLACIDSSVGGKTAINLPQGKNMVGTFYQPTLVVVDTNFLNTLPKEIFNDGLGEAFKYGLMDSTVWELLKQGVENNLEEFIAKCLKIKVDIVEKDEKESNLRQVLNLGHTFGHAIEILSSFKISHGLAVLKGLVIICRLALKNNDIKLEQYQEIIQVIEKYNLNYNCDYNLEELKKVIFNDKKANNNQVNLICLKNIGNVYIKTIKIDEIHL